jgi:hypothetical protein
MLVSTLPKWTKIICQHPDYKYPSALKWVNSGFEYPICTNCKKIKNWLLFECEACEEVFLKDFQHPSFCCVCPLCFNCLELQPSFLCEHSKLGSHYNQIREEMGIIPPRLTKLYTPVDSAVADALFAQFMELE